MVSHNSSVTSSLAMLPCYPLNGFVRLTYSAEVAEVEEVAAGFGYIHVAAVRVYQVGFRER